MHTVPCFALGVRPNEYQAVEDAALTPAMSLHRTAREVSYVTSKITSSARPLVRSGRIHGTRAATCSILLVIVSFPAAAQPAQDTEAPARQPQDTEVPAEQ